MVIVEASVPRTLAFEELSDPRRSLEKETLFHVTVYLRIAKFAPKLPNIWSCFVSVFLLKHVHHANIIILISLAKCHQLSKNGYELENSLLQRHDDCLLETRLPYPEFFEFRIGVAEVVNCIRKWKLPKTKINKVGSFFVNLES